MERYNDVITQTVELLDTMGEAISYVESILHDAETLSQVKNMMTDITEGFYQIENALQPLRSRLVHNQIYEEQEVVKLKLKDLLSAEEKQDMTEIWRTIEVEFIPAFWLWQKEIKRAVVITGADEEEDHV